MGALIDHRDDQNFYRNAYAKVTFSRDGVDWEALARIYARAPLAVRPAVEIKRAFGNSYLCCFARVDGELVGAARAMSDGVHNSPLAITGKGKTSLAKRSWCQWAGGR